MPSLVVCGLLLFAVPSFIGMYESFGTELPLQTVLLVRWYRILAFLPFLFLLAWFFWPTPASRGVAALLIALVLSGALFIFGMWAAYSPIFILGSAP